MQVMCSKGCGHAITITQEMIEEASRHGNAIDVSHQVCPTEEQAKQKRFRAEILVYEVFCTGRFLCELCKADVEETVDGWFHTVEPETEHAVVPKETEDEELLTRIAGSANGASFKLVADELTKTVSDLWGKVLSMADTLSMHT